MFHPCLSLLHSVTSVNTTLLPELMLPAAKACDHGTPGTHASPLTSDSFIGLASQSWRASLQKWEAVLSGSRVSYLVVCCGEGTHPSVAHGTTQTRRMLSWNNHTAFRYILVYNHQDWTSGAGEMAKQFRALAALRGDLGLVTRHLHGSSHHP